MTDRIRQEIDKFKGKMSEKQLHEYINDFSGKYFTLSQIRYQVELLLAENFGTPDLEVYTFVDLAKKDVAEKGGFFAISLDEENRLQRALYISQTMLLYAQSFLDIIIIDATYKKNRFNLPLVNIIGIFFCLLI